MSLLAVKGPLKVPSDPNCPVILRSEGEDDLLSELHCDQPRKKWKRTVRGLGGRAGASAMILLSGV